MKKHVGQKIISQVEAMPIEPYQCSVVKQYLKSLGVLFRKIKQGKRMTLYFSPKALKLYITTLVSEYQKTFKWNS